MIPVKPLVGFLVACSAIALIIPWFLAFIQYRVNLFPIVSHCALPRVYQQDNVASTTVPTIAGQATEVLSARASGALAEGKIIRQAKTGSKHVALAFYGLTRSLQYTIDSIKQNVMDPLTQAGHKYDVYVHTYNLTVLNNTRSHESGTLNTTEWQLLTPDYVQIDDQDKFLDLHKLPIQACKSFSMDGVQSASSVDVYKDNYKSYQNVLSQLNSIQQVTSMWRGSGVEYDAVLYLRPDMLFNCPLPVHLLNDLRRHTVYIADFHHWGGYNDRFAMGRPESVGLWGDRLQFVLSTCMMQRMHPETMVRSLLDHYKLEAELIPFYFFRVRMNGIVSHRDIGDHSSRVPVCDAEMFKPFQERQARLEAEKRQSEAR